MEEFKTEKGQKTNTERHGHLTTALEIYLP